MNMEVILDRILEKYKEYKPIVHTFKEKEFYYIDGDNGFVIEIKNPNGKSLFIDLEDEITISFGDWHCHYYYEDWPDIEDVLEKVDNILNNKDCYLIIFSNNKYFGCGSSINKDKYNEDDIVDFIWNFSDKMAFNKFSETFKKYGAVAKCVYWDKNKNYEINVNKEKFNI